ncbi:MAG: hypothetical protein FWC45_06815 [Treponema sp.]|nr:hypothetical protein [Treponema sp.]
MKKILSGLAILGFAGLVLAGCSNPAVGNANFVSRAAGAGHAGWAEADDFQKQTGNKDDLEFKNGVWRTGGSAWEMAIEFSSEWAEKSEVMTKAPEAIKWGTKNVVVWEDKIIPDRTVVVPPKVVWEGPRDDLGDDWFVEVTDEVTTVTFPKKDVFGWITDETPLFDGADPAVEKFGGGPSSWGGWAIAEDFPKSFYNQVAKNGKTTEIEYVKKDSVIRSGGSSWFMAIAYDANDNGVPYRGEYDLINGQKHVTGQVIVESDDAGIKVSLKGFNEKDRGVIQHIGFYNDWTRYLDLGNGQYNGNEFVVKSNPGTVIVPAVHPKNDKDIYNVKETVYIGVHGYVDRYLGLWGKVGEYPDLDNPIITTETVTSKELVNEKGPYTAEEDEDGWVTITRKGKELFFPGFTVKIPRLEVVEDKDNPIEWSPAEYVDMYKVTVDIIQGKDEKIGDFSVYSMNGDVYLSWKFDEPSNSSHIQSKIHHDLASFKVGLGTWDVNDNFYPDADGVYIIKKAVTGFDITTDKLYVSAHVSG